MRVWPGAWRWAALVLYAVLVLLRMPEIVLKGRFWAEEGTVFFVNAWTMPPLSALFTSYGGYLNLVANGGTLLARWAVALPDAPWVTVGVALVFQLLPPAIVLWARDGWLADPLVRGAGLVLLLFVPGSDEIWLQTLHCQFELALCCGMILALEVPRGVRAVPALAILVLAPLCGPGAIALVPLFLVRAVLERRWGRAVQLGALAGGSAVQLGWFFALASGRGYTLDPAVLLSVVTVKDLVVPLLGLKSAVRIAAGLQGTLAAGHVPWVAVALPVVVFGGLTAVMLREGNRAAFWLLAGAAVSALAAYVGALDGTSALLHERTGARYSFVPLSLTALSVLALAAGSWRPTVRWGAALCCAWLAIVGLQAYAPPWITVRDGPAWPAQVALWRADPSHVIQIWPSPWTVRLPRT